MALSLFFPVIAEVFLGGAAVLLVLVAAFTGERRNAAVIMRNLSIVSLAIAALLALSYGTVPALAFGGIFITSPFMVYMKILMLLGAILVLLMARWPLEESKALRPEFFLLLVLSVLGMMVLISANDLLALYMGLELQSLPLYVIAAMRRDSSRSSEAGLKYFLLGALSSGLLLYGLSLIYGFSGATNYSAIATALAGGVNNGMIIGLVFLIAGIAFKISAAPFHMWTPDVYEGSPTIVTAFFAVAPKIAAMTLFLRVSYGMFGPAADSWQQVVIAIAAASMVVGAFGALMQTNVKRLLAYSSIAHMGYALVGLASALPGGVSAVMLYMTIYAASAVGIFAIILTLSRDGAAVVRITDLAGYSKTHPLFAACMLLFMFSMAGIPPLAGFFAKWFVFSTAINAGLVPLAIFGVLTSVVGAFYYIRIIKIMYVDEPADPLDAVQSKTMHTIVLSMAIFITLLVLGLNSLRGGIAETLPYFVVVLG